ncbi:MAG TPA: hypothetical protein VHL11_00945, partial [Phototrophicaceae bacterium]|nr:hypothetical protein [Phototrophicaceae bacterium]
MRSARTQVQNNPQQHESLVYRLQSGITLALGLITIAAFIIYLIAALNWRTQLFAGVMLNNAVVVNRAQSSGQNNWNGLKAGLQAGDKLLSINGTPLSENPGDFATRRATLSQILSTLPPGEAAVEYSQPDGTVQTVTYRINSGFPDRDFFVFFVIPYLSGLVVLGMGLGIAWFKYHQLEGLLAACVCFLMALFMGGIFDLGTTYLMSRLWFMAGALLGGAILSLGLIFPAREKFTYQEPRIIFAPLVITLIVSLVNILIYDQGAGGNFGLSSLISIVCLMVGALITGGLMYRRYRGAATRTIYDQSSMILVGLLLSTMPGVLWLIAQLLRIQDSLVSIEAMMPFLITPIFGLTVALFHSRRLDTDFVFSRTVTYFVLMVALIVGYFLLVLGASLIAGNLLPANNPTL